MSYFWLTTIDCKVPLGMEDGAISDDQITASSQWSDNNAAKNARLNFERNGDWGWTTGTNNLYQWLQVDHGSSTSVTGVATQGTPDYSNNWLTKYKLQFSDDGVALHFYKASNDTSPMVYQCIIIALCS